MQEKNHLEKILKKALEKRGGLSHADLEYLLSLEEPEGLQKLFQTAYQLKLHWIGPRVSLRGLVETGNYCVKNCLYCGIRRDNHHVKRYQLTEEQVIRMVRWAYDHQYGSAALQSGELESEENTQRFERILRAVHTFGGDHFGITLSLGEQTEEVYRRWKDAGAHRYLLRIESSDPELYAHLHPAGHSYARRRECLHLLKKCGYQLGTGVMIGLPGQTVRHLASDIEFFAEVDADMIGMGPYLPHHETPLGKDIVFDSAFAEHQLHLGLKMIAAVRLYLHDVNIAATTALQALAPDGRERGLLAGANVIMPNVTDTDYRENYQLYEKKPGMDENSESAREKLIQSLASIGEEILWNKRGDSKHFTGTDA